MCAPAPIRAARADEITLFDGTGVGLQDLAAAAAAIELAIERGVAIEVDVQPGLGRSPSRVARINAVHVSCEAQRGLGS